MLLNDVRSHDAQGELLCLVGEQIPGILRGEVETLEIMLAEGRLTRHYEADVVNAHLSQILGDLADNLSNLEPNLKILEVGGGTAGTTLPVMEGLSRFFEMARSKLSRWQQRIAYKKLDITVDPSEQGFAVEDYDIVIAANVLHATADMVSTMKNVRSLLKPGGKIFLLEANMHPPSVLPFALLPGWWAAEDEYRDHSEGPMMPVAVWDRLLRDSGFSGVDHAIPGVWDAEVQLTSVMTSTKIKSAEENHSIIVCGPFIDDDDIEYAQMVADTIARQLGCETETRPFTELDASEAPYYIFIDSKNHSVMQNPTPETFESVKSMLLNNAGLIWVTPKAASPDAQIITGLLRTLRMEVDVKNLLHLDRLPSTPEGLSGILKLAAILRNSDVRRDQDQDYVWHNGSVHLPRLRQLREVKEQFAVEQGISFRKEQNIWDGDRALEMTINAAGSPDSIYFRRTGTLQQPLGDDEVLVRVEAAGVSHRDLNLVLGAIPWAPPGFDGAGRIVKAGARVSHLREGDGVFFLALDSSAFSTYKVMPAWQVARIPAGMKMTNAAGIALAYSLAVLALCHTARLRSNETVLIHSAVGAVGQACVTLAQHLGALVFVTAGTEAKREYLHTEMGIPKDRIFSSRTPEFRDSILCATGNKGVDVIVNSLGGELMVETWSLAASFGRFVDIGKKDAFQNNNLPMRSFDNNVTFSGVDIRELYRHKPDDMRDVFGEAVSLLQRNIIRRIQTVTFPISQFGAALRKLKGSETIGKLVVTLDDDDRVMAESSLRPSEVSLRADATYLVTGGTRGIGLDLAYWMIDHGARNLVLLSRSGATGPDVQKLLNNCEGTDVCVRALACNVGIREELAAVVEAIKNMPPVRGVIHSALLLSDKLCENATHEDWSIVCTPRVQGAWNLQELMPNDLDFFVALSSFNGDTGNIGQAIYAGTAGFYDAFARARNARGQHTVSISLPIVLDVGYVADNNLGDILKQTLGVTLKMADIRTIFKGAVAGSALPFHTKGRATAFKLYVNSQPVPSVQWQYFHPVHTKERLKADRDSRLLAGRGAGGEAAYASWTAATNPLEGLTEALVTKVAAMTMMEREDVLPDAPLASYSLDSLVSVELRNWIRRETAVELTLSAITKADNLRALAIDILAQREDRGVSKE